MRPRPAPARLSAVPLATALLAACRAPAAPAIPEGRGYPGHIVPAGEITSDFTAQQQVSGRYREQTFRFRVVLQKRGDVLKVVGLTPFNTKAFLLEQRGVEVTFRPYLEERPPFPPRYILQDIHRTFFFGLPGGPLADGEHRGEREGEQITERWAGGALQERRFARLSGDPPGEIGVRYEGGYRPGEAPPPIEFSNGWFGYTLRIETDEFRRVP